MEKGLKILILEDDPSDAELIKLELKKTNKEFESRVVQDKKNFLAELESFRPDLILSDYAMPQFTGLDALEIAKKKCPEIPFIIVTGSVNEETAIKCMRWGAWDYVLKNKLVHLGHAVRNALKLKAEKGKKKLAEESLRKSEEQFRLIAENTSDVISLHTFDLKATYTYVSPSIKAMSGYEPEELLGKSGFDFIHPEDKKKLFLLLKKYLNLKIKKLLTGKESKISETIEFRFKDKTGNWRFMHSTINIVGKKLLSVARDITERKQAEVALRESEEKYRTLIDDVLDTSVIGIFILSKDFKVIWINNSTEIFFGLKRDDVIGQDKKQLIQSKIKNIFEDSETFRKKVFTTYDNNTYIENFECHVLPDGDRKERWLEHWSQPIKSGLYNGGRIEHYSDITDRKQAEEALQHRGEFERLITALSTNFINLASDEIDDGINHALQTTGEFIGVDRSYVFLFSKDGTKMDNTHEWCAEGIEPQIYNLKGLSVEDLPWWMDKLNRVENIYIPRVADLSPEASTVKEILQPQGIQSLIVVPMVYGKTLVGYLGFDSVRTEKRWSEDSIALLKIVGEIFVNALKRKSVEEVLHKKLEELETFNRVTVDRELKMVELKKEINELLKELGKDEKYKIAGAKWS